MKKKYILFFISGLFITIPHAHAMRAACRVASKVAGAPRQVIHQAAAHNTLRQASFRPAAGRVMPRTSFGKACPVAGAAASVTAAFAGLAICSTVVKQPTLLHTEHKEQDTKETDILEKQKEEYLVLLKSVGEASSAILGGALSKISRREADEMLKFMENSTYNDAVYKALEEVFKNARRRRIASECACPRVIVQGYGTVGCLNNGLFSIFFPLLIARSNSDAQLVTDLFIKNIDEISPESLINVYGLLENRAINDKEALQTLIECEKKLSKKLFPFGTLFPRYSVIGKVLEAQIEKHENVYGLLEKRALGDKEALQMLIELKKNLSEVVLTYYKFDSQYIPCVLYAQVEEHEQKLLNLLNFINLGVLTLRR